MLQKAIKLILVGLVICAGIYAGSGVLVQMKMNYKKNSMEITCTNDNDYPCTVYLNLVELDHFKTKYSEGDTIKLVVPEYGETLLSLKAKKKSIPRINILADFVKGDLSETDKL